MKPSFNYFSLKYLNQWLQHDSIYCEQLNSSCVTTQLKGFGSACKFYGIARNLPLEHDEKKGVPRYLPAVVTLNNFDFSQLLNSELSGKIQAQLNFENELSEKYGGEKRVLSLVTKILWLKHRSSVIIYDSRAKKALGYKGDDLAEYTAKWFKAFDEYRSAIEDCCTNLEYVVDFSIDPEVATKEYVRNITSKQWFHERVFDMYLWHYGG
ncbi:hypothetical protein [Vibrio parahaemolyticus]|uniref:hypothetical protein n=1 Tax=Vibrio parahaemolyticus TaxID=670 RepID=UPI00186A5D51|nr:hypothetical protein [Vibrio parahaemolyticus]MBE3794222.1 hypothetical protein [Vibrio parahaemolyticus]